MMYGAWTYRLIPLARLPVAEHRVHRRTRRRVPCTPADRRERTGSAWLRDRLPRRQGRPERHGRRPTMTNSEATAVGARDGDTDDAQGEPDEDQPQLTGGLGDELVPGRHHGTGECGPEADLPGAREEADHRDGSEREGEECQRVLQGMALTIPVDPPVQRVGQPGVGTVVSLVSRLRFCGHVHHCLRFGACGQGFPGVACPLIRCTFDWLVPNRWATGR